VASTAGTSYEGAVVAGTAVLFPHDLHAPVTSTTFTVPAGTARALVTGLQPDTPYAVTTKTTGTGTEITVTTGASTRRTDSGGVLAIPAP